jgi:hypothetical protein
MHVHNANKLFTGEIHVNKPEVTVVGMEFWLCGYLFAVAGSLMSFTQVSTQISHNDLFLVAWEGTFYRSEVIQVKRYTRLGDFMYK